MSDIKPTLEEAAGHLEEEPGEAAHNNKKLAPKGCLLKNTGQPVDGTLPKLDGPHMH